MRRASARASARSRCGTSPTTRSGGAPDRVTWPRPRPARYPAPCSRCCSSGWRPRPPGSRRPGAGRPWRSARRTRRCRRLRATASTRPRRPAIRRRRDPTRSARARRRGRRGHERCRRARPRAARLELGLHEQHQVGVFLGARLERGRDGQERDERQVRDGELDRTADLFRRQRSDVHAFEHHHAWIGTQRPRELTTSHVDGDDRRRAPLEQAVGEPAGRGARVERAPTVDSHLEVVERPGELLATARDESRRGLRDGDRLVAGDLAGGNPRGSATDPDPAGTDRLDSARARLGRRPRRTSSVSRRRLTGPVHST